MAEQFEDIGPTGLPRLAPVFVAGCSRSGTTLLGSMLGSHPKVVSPPEPQFLPRLMPQTPGSRVDPGETVDAIEQHRYFRFWEWDLAGRRPPPDGFWTYRDVIDWLMRVYAEDLGKHDITHFVDHTGVHVFHAKRLSQEFPGLRFLHVVRDGRAVAASLMKTDFGGENIVICAEHWTQMVGLAYTADQCLPETPFVHLRYEDIVSDPEATMKSVANYLQIAFVPEMLGSSSKSASRYTQNYHRLVGKPPDPSAIDRWRNTLAPRKIEIFESMTGDLLSMLGYIPNYSNPRPMTIPERAEKLIATFFRKVYNRLHLVWRRWRFGR